MLLKEDWEFNVLGVANYKRFCFKQRYFDFIAEHAHELEGDILEAGVFQGKSILATAHLLKELGSDKQVYGFDSFSGFPAAPNPKDDPARFEDMRRDGVINQEHYDRIRRHRELLSVNKKAEVCQHTISTSEDFSDTQAETIQRKADYLGLDNLHLVQGFFSETMSNGHSAPGAIMAGLIDCDLYDSYHVALPFIWNRLCVGGYLFLDEYYSLKFPGGRLAVNEFFADKHDKPQRHEIMPGDFERWHVRKTRP